MKQKYIINARDVGVILGKSPHICRTLLLFEKMGYKSNNIITKDIRRGINCEPIAIDIFKKKYNVNVFKPGFKRHPVINYIGGTVDGMYINDNNERVIIEIKCPKSFNRKIPPHCYAQIQTYLQIHNIKNAKYIEYVVGNGLNIINIKKNDKWWQATFKSIRTFYEELLYWDLYGIINHSMFDDVLLNINYNNIYINYMSKPIDYSKFDKICDDDEQPSNSDIKMLLDNVNVGIGKPFIATPEEFEKIRKADAKTSTVNTVKIVTQ